MRKPFRQRGHGNCGYNIAGAKRRQGNVLYFGGIYNSQMIYKTKVEVQHFKVPTEVIFDSQPVDKMATFSYSLSNTKPGYIGVGKSEEKQIYFIARFLKTPQRVPCGIIGKMALVNKVSLRSSASAVNCSKVSTTYRKANFFASFGDRVMLGNNSRCLVTNNRSPSNTL